MLSGIKFIPRDQLGNEEEKLKNGDKKSKGKETERVDKSDGSCHSSEHDLRPSNKTKNKEKEKKKSKKREYSSDESVSDSDDGGSGNSEEDEGFKKRVRKRGKKLRESSSSSDDYNRRKHKNSKHKKEGRYSKDKRRMKMKKKVQEEELSDDDGGGDSDMVQRVDKELARKELGLDWMLRSGSRTNEAKHGEIRAEPQEPEVEEGQKPNPKELNPYLKDNGSGYPDDDTISGTGNKLLSSSVVGDGGASWRLKALKRAKEQAAREGRKLNEVVGERWGSLGELAASLSTSRAAPSHAHLHAIKERKRGPYESSEAVDVKGGGERILSARQDYLHDVSSRNPEMRRPRNDSLSWKKNKGRDMPLEDKSLISSAISSLNNFTNDGSFLSKFTEPQKNDASNSGGSLSASMSINDHSINRFDMDENKGSVDVPLLPKQGLSANQLAAKILQLRVKGKHEEADKLSKEMEILKKEEMEAVVEKQDAKPQITRQQDLGSASRYMRKQGTSNQMKREEDADLHLANIIMKNKRYSMSGREEDEYGFDVAPSKKHNQRRQGIPEEKTIAKQLTTQKERCQFCFESPSRPKHLVISIANFTYLMLPQRKPLVEGHCCIVPMQHEASLRSIDRNVWEEIRNFKKCLLKMFSTREKDLVFLETVIALSKQRRHCLLECIPVPYEVANLAPMYFRKAIEEAEEEWGQHEMKKVIPTSGNLRQVIPENFSYFHVEFGLDKGFVHVIDNDNNFNSGFGLNVVRGLLKLPEEDMYRRQRHESEDNQRQAVMRFARDWEPFDWTKQLD